MIRKKRFHKAKYVPASLTHTNHTMLSRRNAMLRATAIIDKLDFDEKIELFQQLEIAQGIRKGDKSLKALSPVSQQILNKYENLPSESAKAVFAERVKNQVFYSLKKSITEG